MKKIIFLTSFVIIFLTGATTKSNAQVAVGIYGPGISIMAGPGMCGPHFHHRHHCNNNGPRPIWIPGHWIINRWGYQRWMPGHWEYPY
jgi:hypothetical protein